MVCKSYNLVISLSLSLSKAVSLSHALLCFAENADNLGAIADAVECMAHKHVAFNVRNFPYFTTCVKINSVIKPPLANCFLRA